MSGGGGATESSPLLGPAPVPRRSNRSYLDSGLYNIPPERKKFATRICIGLFCVGCVSFISAFAISQRLYEDVDSHFTTTTTAKPTYINSSIPNLETTLPVKKSISLSLFSLMVWGSPGSFGPADKELRIEAIGNLTRNPDWDLMLLSDLWMRPDHATIQSLLPEGHDMTTVADLSLSDCDGNIAPEFCSGLAVISKYPILDVEFTAFDVSGDAFWDYEYFLRRGVGRIRIEPEPQVTVDVFVTSLASLDYNYWYRENQALQLVKLVSQSTADYAILAGDFNVDPRVKEDTYKTVKSVLKDSVEEFYKGNMTKCLDPSISTIGNPSNSYTSKGDSPLLYDYIWYIAGKDKDITVDQYQVPKLTTHGHMKEVSLSNHEAVVAKFSLA